LVVGDVSVVSVTSADGVGCPTVTEAAADVVGAVVLVSNDEAAAGPVLCSPDELLLVVVGVVETTEVPCTEFDITVSCRSQKTPIS